MTTNRMIRIGTRDSQLAVWQAVQVQEKLKLAGYESELVPIKSEGDIDLVTPLYEMGVQGIFTRTLDAALLSDRVDIAVHSMKDVPTQPAKGIIPAAVLKRGNYADLLVPKNGTSFLDDQGSNALIATSSIRRRAQWLHRYPQHTITSLRGNVNTRMRKLSEENWDAAIFAAAGLERTGLRPSAAVELDWMLPAPAQGAIIVVCRENDPFPLEACRSFNDEETALCTRLERDFLRTLMGGCSTPISALATVNNGTIHFRGNIFSTNGKEHMEIELEATMGEANALGVTAGKQLLEKGAARLVQQNKAGG